MKKQAKVVLIVVVAAIIAAAAILLYKYIKGEDDLLTPVGTRAEFVDNTSKYPSMLKVDGSTIVNAKGEQIILNGVMVPEPRILAEKDRFNEDFFKDVFDMGGNVIRVPVDPTEYKRDDYYLWRYLDRIVSWAGRNDNYVIIDLD